MTDGPPRESAHADLELAPALVVGRPRRLVDARTGSATTWGTRAFVEVSDHGLRVRFRCAARAVSAPHTRRKDRVWLHDAVEVFVWPVGAAHLLEFQVSPRAVLRDLKVHDPFSPARVFDDSWSAAEVRTEAALERREGRVCGWRAGLDVSWSDLGAGPDAVAVGLFRVDRHPEQLSALRAVEGFTGFHDRRLLARLAPTRAAAGPRGGDAGSLVRRRP
jgi:hypothetical protein